MDPIYRSLITACGCVLLLALPLRPQTPDSTLAGLAGRSVRFQTRAGATSGSEPQIGELARLDSDSFVVQVGTERLALPQAELLFLATSCDAGKFCWQPVALPPVRVPLASPVAVLRKRVPLSSLVGEWVRVRTEPGLVREGQILGVDSARLILSGAQPGRFVIAPAEISQLWVGTRIGTHSEQLRKTLRWIGAGVGFGIFFIPSRIEGANTVVYGGLALLPALLFGTIGDGVGNFIGSGIPRYRWDPQPVSLPAPERASESASAP